MQIKQKRSRLRFKLRSELRLGIDFAACSMASDRPRRTLIDRRWFIESQKVIAKNTKQLFSADQNEIGPSAFLWRKAKPNGLDNNFILASLAGLVAVWVLPRIIDGWVARS